MPFVPALLVKLSLILVLGLIVVGLMRGFSPAARHLVLLATLAASLALPVVMLVSPQWKVALLPSSGSASSASVVDPGAKNDKLITSYLATSNANPDSRPSPAAGALVGVSDAVRTPSRIGGATDPRALIPLLYLLGVLSVLAWLVVGRLRLDHIAASAWPLDDADWLRIFGEECRSAGVAKRVRLLSSPVVSTPLTWGWRQPVVLLPEDAPDWSEDHRRIVLRHELAHVARADSLAQLLAGFACALYWFHPLVWFVERRLRAECERACDDTVVASGTPAADYAAHLLEVARSARAFGAPGFLSVAMARPSQLEGRLLAVLSETRRRASLSDRARVVAMVLTALLLIPLAAFRAVPKGDARSATAVSATEPGVSVATPTSTPVEKPPIVADPEVAKNANESKALPDTTFDLSAPAQNGGTLVLDLSTGGSVIINSWDKPQVLVHAALAGRDWKRTRVKLTPESGSARLESYYSGAGNNSSSSHTFNITVPRNYDVRVSSAGGGISITGLNGTFRGHTGGGEISISNSSGEADLRTGGGEVHIVGSRLDGSVSTGGGAVRIESVTGGLKGYSGSGPVISSKSGGVSITKAGGTNVVAVAGTDDRSGTTTTTYVKGGTGYSTSFGADGIRVSSAGGALSVPSAPNGAHVATGGGDVRIGQSGGEVYASTGGGSVDIGPASGSVEALTGAGDVTIELEGSSGHSVYAQTGHGQIVLMIPKNLNAVLELESAYTNNLGHKTRIVSDIPLRTTETTNWDDSEGTPRRYIRVQQTVGSGGPVIKVKAVNGDVILRER